MSSKLARDTFNYGLGQVLPKVIGFLLIPLYTAYLSPADFGTFDLAITLSSFFLVVMRLSVPGAITRFYYDYRGGQQEKDYITSLYWFVVGLSFLMGILFLAVSFFFIDNLIPGLPYYPFVVLVAVSAFLNAGSEIQKKLLQVRQQSGYSAKLNVLTALLTISLSIGFVVYFDFEAVGLVLATAIASLALFIQAQFYLWKDLSGRINVGMIKESLRFSLVLFPYHLYGHFSIIVTKSILSSFGSVAAVGVLAIGTKFTQPFPIVVNALGAAFTPQYLSIRTSDTAEGYNKLILIVKQIWFVAVLLFVVFFLSADYLVFLLGSQSYAGSIVVMKILSVGFLPQMFYILFSNELFFRKENKLLLLINMVGITLSILLSWLLIKMYGEIGAAVAVIAPSFVAAALVFAFTIRKMPYQAPWTFVIHMFVLATFVTGVDLLVASFLVATVWTLIIKIFLIFAIWIGCLKIDPKVTDSLESIIRRKLRIG